MAEPVFAKWCELLGMEPAIHRKQWEFVYIAQALGKFGLLDGRACGLGFGVGKEPMPALFASLGVDTIVSDQPQGNDALWVRTNQYSGKVDDLHHPEICSLELLREHATWMPIDMNNIAPVYRNSEFDFAWSASSLDHLGSIRQGLDFIRASLECVKPGGVVVHTTEFNLRSNDATLDNGWLVLFRERDLVALAAEMAMQGHWMTLNLTRGNGPYDLEPAHHPYNQPHLCMELAGHVFTSVGLTIQKSAL